MTVLQTASCPVVAGSRPTCRSSSVRRLSSICILSARSSAARRAFSASLRSECIDCRSASRRRLSAPSVVTLTVSSFTRVLASLNSFSAFFLARSAYRPATTGVDKGEGAGGQKRREYFYQMSNMYTCIAYLIEIRKFCSKNVVHKGVNFEAQNALKLTYEHL